MGEMGMIFCIMGAMIGAGFASGRELMQFFSRYGAFSWVLILISGITIQILMLQMMKNGKNGMQGLIPSGRTGIFCRGVICLLLIAAAGSMTAAAGELAALTIPIHSARWIGMTCTLIGCLAGSRYPLGIMGHLGKILLPLLIGAFLLCMRIPGEEINTELSACEMLLASVKSIGYAGMNGMLSAGILCEAGAACEPRGICRKAAWAAGAMIAVLFLGNGVLVHHRELQDAPLPMVILLQHFGKPGYYLSAGVLYLAVVTTLIAALQGLTAMLGERLSFPRIIAGLLSAMMALAGFERIVGMAYPGLGLICIAIFLLPKKKGGGLIQPPVHIPE